MEGPLEQGVGKRYRVSMHSLPISMCSPAQKLSKHYPFEFLWNFHYIGMID